MQLMADFVSIVAGLIFLFKFEVYRNGLIYTETGSNYYPVRRLRFSQDLSSGHIDAYLPISAQKITRRRMEVGVEEHDFGIDTTSLRKVNKGCQEVPVLERQHSPIVSSINYNENIIRSLLFQSESVTLIEKTKNKLRARFTNYTRKNQIKKAQTKYRQNLPESHRKAVSDYEKQNLY